jgi:hypothetical protein
LPRRDNLAGGANVGGGPPSRCATRSATSGARVARRLGLADGAGVAAGGGACTATTGAGGLFRSFLICARLAREDGAFAVAVGTWDLVTLRVILAMNADDCRQH